MQGNDNDEEDLRSLCLGGTENGVEISEEEEHGSGKTEGDEKKVEDCTNLSACTPAQFGRSLTVDGAPADQSHRDPNQVRISVQTNALEQIGALATIPLEYGPQPRRHHSCVSIHHARTSAQQLEVIDKVVLAVVGQVLVDGAGEEKDDDDGGGDPHGPVQVRVALEHVKEVLARIYGGGAATQDLVGVNVEGLGVEGEGP